MDNKRSMEVKVDAKIGKIDDKDVIDIQASIDNQKQAITRYIYEKTDEAILNGMPQEILEDMYRKSKKELKRRRNEN